MNKTQVIICLTFFYFFSKAQFIATYNFDAVTSTSGSVDLTTPLIVTGASLQAFRAVGLSENSSAGGRFSFSHWPLGGIHGIDTYSLFTGALSGLKYYEVRLSVVNGYTLNIEEISFGVRRSGTGPRNFSLRSNKNNFNSDLAASTGTNTRITLLPTNIFFWKYDSVSVSSDQKDCAIFPGESFTAITDSVVFRFYAWNAEALGGSFSIDNVSFKGIVYDSSALNPTSINENNLVSDLFSYYLNLEQERITVEAYLPELYLQVLDFSGKQMFDAILQNQQQLNFDTNVLTNGIYFLISSNKNSRQVRKIIIQR